MSRRSAYLVSAMMLFGMIGGVGMHSSAAEEVQAVRRQFSTSEEITSICVNENNASVTIHPGKSDQTYVSYADTSKEILYDIYVEDGTLVVDKLKANPREPIITDQNTHGSGKTSKFSSEDLYRLEITVPQKQYESITITNISYGYADLNSISSKNICIQLKTGFAELSQTKSNYINAEIDKGYIALGHTDSLQYDLKVETGKITGNVLGCDDEYSIEQSIKHGISNLTSNTISKSDKVMKLDLGTGLIKIDFINPENTCI